MTKQFFFFIMLLGTRSVAGQGKWELNKNENGIEVYTRKAATGNLKEVRVICELVGTKTQLVSILFDIARYDEWVYSNKKSALIKTINAQKIIYYAQSHLPWPVKDRDLVTELTASSTSEVLTIQAKSLPAYLPKVENFIRIPYSLAIWKVTRAPNNKLKIDYILSIDPGGDIPAWAVNATITTGSYNSFAKLKEVLKNKSVK